MLILMLSGLQNACAPANEHSKTPNLHHNTPHLHGGYWIPWCDGARYSTLHDDSGRPSLTSSGADTITQPSAVLDDAAMQDDHDSQQERMGRAQSCGETRGRHARDACAYGDGDGSGRMVHARGEGCCERNTSTTLLTHIASQTASNIDFLVANGYVTQTEAAGLQRKLSSLQSTSTPAPVRSSAVGSSSIPPPPPAAPAPTVIQVILWAYNLDASDPDDLSFAAGDIITIVEETNADWWLGEHNGCRALFPANYVEKITAPAPAARTLPPVYIPPTGSRSVPPAPATTQKKEYKPFMAAHSGSNVPPPPRAGTNSVGLQQDPGQEGKKSKFGKYGNTMAHSAAVGVGFGAGAAIGDGLVRAIF
ncbi:uncharacterized protein EV420DRAFT_1654854 [Desarmillaria tabescens]|uniref:SH3 domain-containing protein n=1 Tax=Armillaria tabescens TaxID=1929756 RepID=A0AA39J1R3_ARMTA|nr:uncharacterized protein EV420DRAFT_1654854 [Desarmillaria tabescens]KAK0433224.1 hypothetical protein EV420DRAFT_1654854 [Desarmillaria tabescens]